MPIIFSLVAKGTIVYAEYATHSGNFPDIARKLLTKIPPQNSTKSYAFESYQFHYLVQDGNIYLCMADTEFGHRLPFAYLAEIQNRFLTEYGSTPSASAESFSRVLKERMDFYSNDPNADKISVVREQVREVKDQMVQNIDKVLERGEKIETLVDKTDSLHTQSFDFKKKSRKLKRKLWWKNAKLMILLVYLLILVVGGTTFGLLYYFGIIDLSSVTGGGGDSGDNSNPSNSSDAALDIRSILQ